VSAISTRLRLRSRRASMGTPMMSQRVRSVTAMLLGSPCAVCERPGGPVCPACSDALEPGPSLPAPLHVDRCVALLAYDDAARPLLTGLKNRDRRAVVGWLAARLAASWRPPADAVLTWAPTGDARRRARGFDQAELLARALGRRWGLPVRPLLRRRPGPPQVGRSAGARRTNPRFAARWPAPPEVVLVDDIATTGATLTAAARSLRRAGTVEVHAVVAARAPARAPRAASG
jgi:predicted amidophosphoribosyltransferase